MRTALHVIETDDGYRMYYSGTDGMGGSTTCMATSSDGTQWTKYNDPATTEVQYQESDPCFYSVKRQLGIRSGHQPRVFPNGEDGR
ncbi:hypothetical protein [Candidatus Villigracilis affinis]|uniref:hypothetical protein n=1 Tax=Candidatus Villigracilis affinis TaxID=3140682 RepID=UPI002A218CD5|nr:hypothetical protein [Anaerolineales bacterium]